jgi:hypothetical protein
MNSIQVENSGRQELFGDLSEYEREKE